MSQESDFWRLANQAMKDGLVTRQEVNIICRPGTRKYGYFGRHLYDLKWWIEWKSTRV